LPPGIGRAQALFIQRAAGNRAAQSVLGSSAVTVQRKGASISGLKKAVGLGKKKSSAAKAETAGAKAQSAKVVTVADLEKQVSTLEAATRKLIKDHKPGDTAGHTAALQVHAAAERIRGNLPDQSSKASNLLGRTYPDQVRKLRWISDETQLILDEVRVADTRKQAGDIYLKGGRDDASQPGALTKLTGRSQFKENLQQPAPNAAVLAHLKAKGFASYEKAFENVLATSASDPRAEGALKQLQPELFSYTEKSRSRATAQALGLSPAELAAIQTYSAEDYRYINPATANDPAWLAGNFSNVADKPKELTALREEGGCTQASPCRVFSRCPRGRAPRTAAKGSTPTGSTLGSS
jgi:hypothetical protein